MPTTRVSGLHFCHTHKRVLWRRQLPLPVKWHKISAIITPLKVIQDHRIRYEILIGSPRYKRLPSTVKSTNLSRAVSELRRSIGQILVSHTVGGVPVPLFKALAWCQPANSRLWNMTSRNYRRYCILPPCKTHLDIVQCLAVTHHCDRQTDRQTDRAIALCDDARQKSGTEERTRINMRHSVNGLAGFTRQVAAYWVNENLIQVFVIISWYYIIHIHCGP